MKKWKVNCIIEHQIEVEANTLEEAVELTRIEEVERNIMINGSDDYLFIGEDCQ
jgi:hypothetical protein